MKLAILASLFLSVSCMDLSGLGTDYGNPDDAFFVLTDTNGVEVTSVEFDEPIDPSVDSERSVELEVRNDGKAGSFTYPYIAGQILNGSSYFSVTTEDPRCRSDKILMPGESCKITLKFSKGDAAPGVKTDKLVHHTKKSAVEITLIGEIL